MVCSRCWRRCASTGLRCSPGSGWRWWSTRSMVRSRGGSMSCACSRTGRARCSISWSISSPMSSCRHTRSPPAACCCRSWRRCWALGIVVSGALYFADRRMKTDDNHFRGFPALWNAAAFYLFLLHPRPWLASLMVALLIVLTFVPFNVMHPVRVVRLRGLTLSLIGIWAVLAIYRTGQGFRCQRARNHRTLCDRLLCRGERRSDPAREVFQGMMELLTSPEAWAALLTLTALEIVLGIDNVIFLSVIVSRPSGAAGEAGAADRVGAGAGVPHHAAQCSGVADRSDAARHHRERISGFRGAISS